VSVAITRLRAERAAALESRGSAADGLARADAALAEAARLGVSDDDRAGLERERARALSALQSARGEERRARDAIGEAVAQLEESPIDRIGRLDARYPVAFFPVRIETRFVRAAAGREARGADELLVRIYPDGLLAQAHEPLLTQVEVEAGEAYWQRDFDGMPEAESWTLLLGETDAQRAAWIVEQTTPLNLDALAAGGVDPVFPPQEVRPPGWHRPPEAPILPERWIVTTYRDGARREQVVSSSVREGLALTPRMSADGDDPALDDAIDVSGDGLRIEPDLRWAYDFDEAVAAGMAVRVPLTAEDLAHGFSTVLVVGVRTTGDAETGAGELETLLDGHRFSRGLAFVPQGGQTNNSADAPSAYPEADPAGSVSFAIARGAPLAAEGTDGYRFMRALGLDIAAADHLAGSERDEQTRARAMVDALWPATIGYFLTQLMAPEVDDATRDALRTYMRDHVRARGPFPAFRVGDVPYGLLPVGALGRWEADSKLVDDPVAPRLPGGLRRLGGLWSAAESEPPHVGRSGDPDADLVETLGEDASAQTVQIRPLLGRETLRNLVAFAGVSFDPWRGLQRGIAGSILDALGRPEWDPRVLHVSLADHAHDFGGPLVQKPPLSETAPLTFDYIAWMRTASPSALKNQLAPPTDEPLDALLYLMLRHALLSEYDSRALDLLGWRQLASGNERLESELVGIYPAADGRAALAARPGEADRTAWERFDERIPGVTGDQGVGAFLADPTSATRAAAPEARAIAEDLNAYRASLQALEATPSAELERLFTETLDACSHRLDPWITGLYTERLAAMRADRPRGVHVGCYGWVEDLVPDPPPERVGVPGAGGAEEQALVDSGGYVYAPSMLHGATAAVLRSAYLTRSGGGEGDIYAVDLSSRRCRAALSLLDSVRDDQPLGAALGYGFERGLHEGHPGVELDRFIDEFRGLYPLVANKVEDSGQPAESVAARNVVDGLRLRAAWRSGEIPWGAAGLTPSTAQRQAIEKELVRLDDTVDSVSDLLLAESVHQVLRGSTAGAAATLDSLAKGHRAPEPDVAATPRGGTVLHQRVALVVGGATLPSEWDAMGPTPRALAAPELNAWLAAMLGLPGEIACTVVPEGGAAGPVTVEELGVQPIDLLAEAAAADATSPGADLDRRVAGFVAGAVGADVAVRIDYADPGGAALSLGEALELLAEVSRTLGFARPLEARDLLPPERESALATADPMAAEADGRAASAAAELAAVALALDTAAAVVRAAPPVPDPDLGDLRDALARASSLGVSGTYPAGRNDNSASARTALLGRADTVAAALAERAAAAAAATGVSERLRAIFGRGFPVLPRFVPAEPALLAPALATEPDLGAGGDAAVEDWFSQVARVREPLDPWRQVVLYARALGRDMPRPRIVQLPLESAGGAPRWAALDYDGGEPHRSGLCSLALYGEPPAAAAPWSGLLFDAWPEILPNREEDAGVVFHFDAPGAQAPQCVLLAVPPRRPADTWSYDILEETLLDTLRMARMRAMKLGNLGAYGQVLPLAYLAANAQNVTVATSFVGLAVADATIVGPAG
jgi:hypothetical protein